MTQPPATSTPDRLAVGYQLKIHLLGISPQISRRVLVRGDTTLAELHHVFQVVMGWENWHLHCFHLRGKDYGLRYAGGTWVADDARRVHLGDFAWRVNDKFTYTYDFGDYWQHQVRVEKVLLPAKVPAVPVCVSGCRACPPEEVGGPSGYDQRTLDQFSWRYEALDRLLAGEDIREDDVPTWFWTYQPEHFDQDHVNRKLAKLYLASVGLTLAESKALLQHLQQTMITQQVAVHLQAHRPIGLRKKGSYPLQLKTLFGNVTVDSPRYYLPPTETGPKTFSPLQHLFPQHVTPERLYLETKWASLIPYQKTADLLHDVLPLSEKLSGTTIQQHLHAVVEAQEQQLPLEVAPFHGVCQRDREALPCPARPLVVGLDGGYVRHWHATGCFEVIAGKSIPAEGSAKCFGFVQVVDAKPRRRVLEVLRSQGLQANQAVEFFTDGAAVLRSLTSYLRAESTHILDWFHLTMRLTVLHQYALGFAQVDTAGGKALQDGLTSLKWHLWHGNAERALEKIRDLDDALATHQDDPLVARKYSKYKPLARLLADFHTYVEQNSGFIVDYSERQRYGERVSTGFVESAVNQVLAKRMVKRQQMQWTKKGAHLLVQARTKVVNEEWEDCFRQQYPGFRSVPAVPLPMAA